MSQNINSRSNIDNAMVGKKVVTQFSRVHFRRTYFKRANFQHGQNFFCFLNSPFREILIFT